jgi:hypothetical protein
MAQSIQDARYAVVTHDPGVITTGRIFDGGWYMLIPFMIVGAVLMLGVVYFRRQSPTFAEDI